MTRNNFNAVRYEWKDSIDLIVNPADEYLQSFFVKQWDITMVRQIFPEYSILKETNSTLKAFCHFIKLKLLRDFGLIKDPVSFETYNKMHGAQS